MNKCLDDELYDIYIEDGKQIIESLREIYAKGKADKYQEITSEYMLLTEKQVADISTNAIDEIAELLIKRCWSKMGDLEYVSEEEIKEIAEQLKEQNNGSK